MWPLRTMHRTLRMDWAQAYSPDIPHLLGRLHTAELMHMQETFVLQLPSQVPSTLSAITHYPRPCP
jgi:hypothetical protein